MRLPDRLRLTMKAWALLALLVVPIALLGWSKSALAQGANRAIVVVDYGGGRVEQHCVYFDGYYITGEEALAQAVGGQVVFEYAGQGVAVCKIKDVGCDDPRNCFCESYQPPYSYWSYWLRNGSEWQYSPQGCSGRQLGDGDADGWSWVVQPPPAPDFSKCQQADATATPSSTATRTPTGPPTATRTNTPTPTGTPTPTTTLPPAATAPPTGTATPIKTQTPTATGTYILAQGGETATPTPPPTEEDGGGERHEAQGDKDAPASTPTVEDQAAITAQPTATTDSDSEGTPVQVAVGDTQTDAATPTQTAGGKSVARAQPKKTGLSPGAGPPRAGEATADYGSDLVGLGLLGVSVASLGGAVVLALASALLWRGRPG